MDCPVDGVQIKNARFFIYAQLFCGYTSSVRRSNWQSRGAIEVVTTPVYHHHLGISLAPTVSRRGR